MQTRRKSLNLGDLGVVAPKRSRTQSHPSPPETVVEGEEPPIKKSKRSHASASPPPGLMSPPRTTVIRIKDDKPPKPSAHLSPPPSPVAEGATRNKVDTEGISDDIVVATIQQIEKTGNRPHLVKELAAVLATRLHCVEKYGTTEAVSCRNSVANLLSRSANPSALISSRLTSYLHRPWPTVSPCPLAKDLSPVHPRRLYFYLTTTPHQPIPEIAEPIPHANRIISPSLSSASEVNDDERYSRERQSLSPEVDLSSPELDEDTGADPVTPGGSFSARASRERSSYLTSRRAASPPLETEERDFKQTASALYEEALKRRNSQQSQKDVDMDSKDASPGAEDSENVAMSMEVEESEESLARKNSEAALGLFGTSVTSTQQMEFSSPVIHPQHDRHDEKLSLSLLGGKDQPISLPEAALAWDSLQSPETVDLSELEDMFDAY
ncbi:uncharacterized protein MYCFIDRAFT_213346 [Pseudocercospora fijiensis CIRAD86]|uniref:GDS1 winged helix domain-containing protein n=1 Tax=Pseudocercospora fijiensis (strain CIRAD86) TaxID=383855 RepID=N1Q7F5_PSEFD|nr:uncharacterized protein MYCFIDRAFT_213346 [Pseudocercospora fijiensis CIRAD86]EME88595.1 hypothetical protein MYCFIDRAFT_213346 [Pseudocercospora fijiensis CIRAD86]